MAPSLWVLMLVACGIIVALGIWVVAAMFPVHPRSRTGWSHGRGRHKERIRS